MKRDAIAQLASPPKPPTSLAFALGDDDEMLSPEKTASLLGWSLRTLTRRSADGTGPRIIKLSPRRSGCRRGEVRRYQAACTAA